MSGSDSEYCTLCSARHNTDSLCIKTIIEIAKRCDVCGCELSDCGDMTEDGPSQDCLPCKLSNKCEKLERELNTALTDRKLLAEEVAARRDKSKESRFTKLRIKIDNLERVIKAEQAVNAARILERTVK